MEQSWMGLILSLENHLFPEIQDSIADRRNQLAFIGLMATIDMVMRNCFGKQNLGGFKYFCRNFLISKNPDYAKDRNIIYLWRLRVALTHNWGAKHVFYLLPDLSSEETKAGILEPRKHSHLEEINNQFYLSMGQFYDDVKDTMLNEVWETIAQDESLQISANERISRLFRKQPK